MFIINFFKKIEGATVYATRHLPEKVLVASLFLSNIFYRSKQTSKDHSMCVSFYSLSEYHDYNTNLNILLKDHDNNL